MAKGKYQRWLKEENLILLNGWSRDGLTEEQISHNMGISRSTLHEWRNKFPEIEDAFSKGREIVDYEVESALLKSALGHTVVLKKPMKLKKERQLKDRTKEIEEKIVYVEEEVYIPPQVPAQIFWLKNRKTDKWRNNPEAFVHDEVEDSGLIAALKAEDFDLCDDTDMIIDDEDEEEAEVGVAVDD